MQFSKMYNVKYESGHFLHNFKVNRFMVDIDKQNNVYLTIPENRDTENRILKECYLIANNNIHIWNLLSSNYCQLVLDYIFKPEDIKLFNIIKEEFNIKIAPSEDKEYINFVRKHLIKEGIINE